jgi:hypothetical protein
MCGEKEQNTGRNANKKPGGFRKEMPGEEQNPGNIKEILECQEMKQSRK